jgi:hypothetical protein
MDFKQKPEYSWLGRSLANYVSMHPKAKGARTLTEARKLAFGTKSNHQDICPGYGRRGTGTGQNKKR